MTQFLEKYFECEQERVPSGNIHRPNPASFLAKDAGYPAKLAGFTLACCISHADKALFIRVFDVFCLSGTAFAIVVVTPF